MKPETQYNLIAATLVIITMVSGYYLLKAYTEDTMVRVDKHKIPEVYKSEVKNENN